MRVTAAMRVFFLFALLLTATMRIRSCCCRSALVDDNGQRIFFNRRSGHFNIEKPSARTETDKRKTTDDKEYNLDDRGFFLWFFFSCCFLTCHIILASRYEVE